MEVKGKIILGPIETSGVSKSGNPWKKKEYVLETYDTYPRKVHFTCFGDNADKIILAPGQDVNISFDVESREWNGRWYTDIRAWKAEILPAGGAPVAGAPAAAAAPMSAQAPAMPIPPTPAGAEEDFPF